jgi:hypothetical protein
MSSSIDPVSIPQLNDKEKNDRIQVPKLWNLPKVDKSFQRKLAELEPFQKTYTELLYKIGKDKYNLIPQFDFTVEVILPTGKFSELSYEIIAGPICHLVMTVCPIQEFEDNLHSILEKVRNSVYNKSIDRTVALVKRQEEAKKLAPPFMLYNLEDHHLEIKREQKLTIFDPTTGITVTRSMPAESEPWRLMTHRAKMELIKLNKLVKEFEAREKSHGTFNADADAVQVGSSSNLER